MTSVDDGDCMDTRVEKYEDWPTGSNTRGGRSLPTWRNTLQVDGWVWDGREPQPVILLDGTAVLHHRFVR